MRDATQRSRGGVLTLGEVAMAMDKPTSGRNKTSPALLGKLKAEVLQSQVVPMFTLGGFFYLKNYGAFVRT